MIKSFSSKESEYFYIKGKSKRIPVDMHKTALRKLDYLNNATCLDDLKVPPGNRLELLKGDLRGKYSIRINKQYRIVFIFKDTDAYEVKIIDYH